MSVSEKCDSRTTYRHTGHPPAHYYDPRTRPRAAPCSRLRRQCVANLPHHCCLHSGRARRPYTDRCLRTRRGGRAPHRACSVLVPRVSRQRESLFLDRPSHERLSALCSTGRTRKIVPSGISSSGANRMGFLMDLLILIMPSAAASYRKRSRWRTRTGGSASRSTCWLTSPKLDLSTCTGWGREMCARAS